MNGRICNTQKLESNFLLDITTVKINDLNGKNVIATSSTEQIFSVNIAALSQGIYVCSIEKEGKITTEKFIKK